jgi:Tfp pilus assembly protein FimT
VIRSASHRDSIRAFTLIEMLVLIIIIAIISAIAVPAYARFLVQARFQNSVENTVSLLTWARDAAVQASSDSVVRFDSQTESFQVTVEAQSAPIDLPSAMQETQETTPASTSRGYKLGEDIAVTNFAVYDNGTDTSGGNTGASATELRFHDDGSSNGGRLTMVSMDGYSTAIEIAPVTGRVSTADANGY